ALGAAETAVAKLEKERVKAAKAATRAEKVADEAAQAMDAARLQHRAHDLARELVAGEPCPVCGQEVHELPKSSVPADLKKAEKSAAEARPANKAATEEAARTKRNEAVATDRLSRRRENAQGRPEPFRESAGSSARRERARRCDG